MRYVLTMVDGEGMPFWVFLVQAFCVIVVVGIAAGVVVGLVWWAMNVGGSFRRD